MVNRNFPVNSSIFHSVTRAIIFQTEGRNVFRRHVYGETTVNVILECLFAVLFPTSTVRGRT